MMGDGRGTGSLVAAVTIAAVLVGQARAEFVTVDAFPDLFLWAGSGTNSAAFVLQFSEASGSPPALAWGYRWNGASTAQAMSDAIAGTTTLAGGVDVPPGLDQRLSIAGTQYPFGVFLSGITYDQVGLPAAWSQIGREIVNNWVNDGTYPVLYTRPDAGGVWLGEGESRAMAFSYSQVGASGVELTPGGWYGFVQGTGAETFAFSPPVAAVPEPGSWTLLAGAAVVAWCGVVVRRHRSVV